MNSKIAKTINRACRNETPAFKKELKRTWNKVPRPMRNKFRVELVESCQSKETKDE